MVAPGDGLREGPARCDRRRPRVGAILPIRSRPQGAAVSDVDRRKAQKPLPDILKSELNPDQRETLGELEKFGW